MAESSRYYRIDSRDLVYLKFVLEAYEGLATLSTVDAGNGIIRIGTPCCQSDDLDCLLHALTTEISLTETIPPQPMQLSNSLPSAMEPCHA